MPKRARMPAGGGGGGGGGDLMKQIQQMQSKLADAQSKLDDMEFEATSGGGAVHPAVALCTSSSPLIRR